MVGLINELKGGVGVVRGHTVIREQCVQERTEYAALLQLSSRQPCLGTECGHHPGPQVASPFEWCCSPQTVRRSFVELIGERRWSGLHCYFSLFGL